MAVLKSQSMVFQNFGINLFNYEGMDQNNTLKKSSKISPPDYLQLNTTNSEVKSVELNVKTTSINNFSVLMASLMLSVSLNKPIISQPTQASRFRLNNPEINIIVDTNNHLNEMQLFKKIDIIEQLGDNWDDEYNTPGPNTSVLEKSKQLIHKFVEHNVIPVRIAPTVEEGICFVFEKGNKNLYLELYNEGDIGYISEDEITRKVIENRDIEENEIIPALLNFFNV